MVRRARALGIPLAVGMAFVATQSRAADWDWMVAPYGWAPSISTDIETQSPPSSSSTDTKFGDIVDKIDGAFQIHIEGQGDRWGMFADFTFLGLADDSEHPRFRTESDLDTRLFEIAAVWSPGEGRFEGVDVFAGLRYIDVDMTLELEPTNQKLREALSSLAKPSTMPCWACATRGRCPSAGASRCAVTVRSATPKGPGMQARLRTTARATAHGCSAIAILTSKSKPVAATPISP